MKSFTIIISAYFLFSQAGYGEERVVYHETFPEYRDQSRYLRIAQACVDWTIRRDSEGGRYLEVKSARGRGNRGLVIWDLVPTRLQRVEFEAKMLEGDARLLRPSIALADMVGNSYLVQLEATAPDSEGWRKFSADLETNTEKMFHLGKELSPNVHGQGKEVREFAGGDFAGNAYKTLYLHLNGFGRKPSVAAIRNLKLSVRDTTDSVEANEGK